MQQKIVPTGSAMSVHDGLKFKLITMVKSKSRPLNSRRSKVTLLILLFGMMELMAAGLGQNINLTVKKADLKTVIDQLQLQSGVDFIYPLSLLDEAAPITAKVKNKPLVQALEMCFKEQPFIYIIEEEAVVLRRRVIEQSMESLPIDETFDMSKYLKMADPVRGVVMDAEGNTLIGVNVKLKDSNTGTATDFDGRFELLGVQAGDVLMFSYIGYTTLEVSVENVAAELNITMQSDSKLLDEVVVVGYGTQRRRSVTGSVASVPMEELESSPAVGIDQAINGKIAGVQVNTVSGTPGGGPSIRIRGVSSIGAGSDPLYVIDGFPISNSPDQRTNPLNSIPPSQIVSIEILKDASATAIYGSRGANGVILITTKKGSMGLNVEFNSSIGLQNIRRRGMVPVLNANQFAQFMNDRISDNIRYRENREPTLDDIPEMYQNPDQYGEGTNWVDEIYRPALMQNHNINISGGNESIRTLLSFGYLDQEGTLLETNYKRYNLRVNVNATLTDKLTMGLNIAPSLEGQKLAATDGDEGRAGPQASAFLVNPIAPLRNPDGTLTSMVGGPGLLAYVNPVLKLQEVDHTAKTNRVLFNTYLNYELAENLFFKTTFNVDWRSFKREQYEPTTVGQAFNVYPPDVAVASLNTVDALNWVNENTLNYNTQLGGNHNINALVGFSLQNESVEIGSFGARDFPDDEIRTFNAAPNITGSTNVSEYSLVSGFARLIYDYKDKYLMTGAMRMDGSSKFGSDNRWGAFPSLSVGWRLSGEDFMKENSTFSNILLRAGYGRTGNFNIGNYTHLGRVGDASYTLNNQQVSGRAINNLGNPDLGWEQVDQVNVGLDVSILQDRFNFSLEYYKKVTGNMLLSIETPFTSGFSNAQVNRGEVQNDGVELAFNSNLINTEDFQWDVNFNISHNSNIVTKLESPIFAPASTAKHITEEGYPIGQFYGFQVIGFFNSQEEIDNAPVHPSAIPGSYRFTDVNQDGKIDPVLDFTRIGNPYPDFTYGLSNSLKYKDLDFNISMTGSQGGQKIQDGYEDFHNFDGVFNVHTDVLNAWNSPSEPGAGIVPRPISRVIHRYSYSKWVEDASYIWIRNISLGYSFANRGTGFFKEDNRLRLYLNIQNPWISNTNFQNPDEAVNVNNPLMPGGTRNLNYPISKIYTIGINLNL